MNAILSFPQDIAVFIIIKFQQQSHSNPAKFLELCFPGTYLEISFASSSRAFWERLKMILGMKCLINIVYIITPKIILVLHRILNFEGRSQDAIDHSVDTYLVSSPNWAHSSVSSPPFTINFPPKNNFPVWPGCYFALALMHAASLSTANKCISN